MTQSMIRPFRALRYNQNKIDNLATVIAPPYDVISADDLTALKSRNPHNIVNLDVTKTDESGAAADETYQSIAQLFEEWQKSDVLIQEDQPALYIYEQEFQAPDGQTFIRRGFYGLRRIEPFGEGKMFPHERTLSGPKADRLALMKATSSQMSPIFTLFRDPNRQVALLLKAHCDNEASFSLQDDTGQQHRVWVVTDPQWIAQMEQHLSVQDFFIADGHHRYETALAYSRWRAEQDNNANPDADYNYVFQFCEPLDDDGLLVLPTHRRIKNISGFSASDFLKQLEPHFTIKPYNDLANAKQDNDFLVLLFPESNIYYRLSVDRSQLATLPGLASVDEPLRSLDAAILHKCILEGILGWTEKDQENHDKINYLKSETEFYEGMKNSDTSFGAVMCAPSMEQIANIASAGQFMPPKTTFFYPKLPTGLLVNLID